MRMTTLAAISACCTACSSPLFLSVPRPVLEGSYLVHVVGPASASEDIDTILLWYTGSEQSIDAVRAANKKVNLSALRPGQRLLIPLRLVTHTNPMPRRKFNFGAPANTGPQASKTSATRGDQSWPRDADPLEEMASKKRLSKKAEPERKSAATPETFDLESEDNSQGVAPDRFEFPEASSQVQLNESRKGEAPVVDEFSDQISTEQAELDKLRQELEGGNGGANQPPNPLP